MEVCYYQIWGNGGLPIAGKGDCRICKPDVKNKECKNYIRIRIKRYSVKEER